LNSPTEHAPGATRIQIAAAALALLALWFLLCRHLSSEWSVNEQYSYGWFVPFFALFLFWLRWEDRGESKKEEVERRKRNRRIAFAIGTVALLLLFPIRLFEVANPDWRPLGWGHATAVVVITFIVVWSAGGWSWVRHFAFPILFIFVAVPWITPIEEPIVQGLMRTVAAVATETITLLGVPAQLEGNLIRVSTGLVGVNEACSGVRSLQTSIMIGLLFGELKRLSTPRRVILILGALAIAILANFARAFFLVWVTANENVAAVERWHDFAGYTIVAVVFIGSLALAAFLNRDKKVGSRIEPAGAERHGQSPGGDRAGASESKDEVENEDELGPPTSDLGPPTSDLRHPTSVHRSPFLLPTSHFLLSLLWLLAVEISVEFWYRSHERGLITREQWAARWPESAKDFRDIPFDERTRRILRFDEGRGAMWRIPADQKSEAGDRASQSNGARLTSGGGDSALLYFFRWRAGGNSALLANVHRPDVCLPASGWVQVGDYGLRSYPVSAKFSLPFRHFLFSQGAPAAPRQRFAHAFYCLREDRVRSGAEESLGAEQFAQEPSAWSRRERVDLVVQGRRHLGQQVMEFVLITPQEEDPKRIEARFASLVQELVEQSRK